MSKKVLVIDDDPDVRLFSVTVLEENGYAALEATKEVAIPVIASTMGDPPPPTPRWCGRCGRCGRCR